jgi:S-adenosylmethionine-dependent methyltransferase
MTDFEKIKSYYNVFDEQHRLEKAEGRLEFEIAMDLLLQYLDKEFNILDLGGGAGRYSIELTKLGYKVTLADLSEKLLKQAKDEIENNRLPTLQGIDLVNAVDLNIYDESSFDSVVLFGPLYHLLEADERQKCIAEISRVLKPNGLIFASFIPYLSGAVGVVSRALYFPDQVNCNNLSLVFESGKFINNTNIGFQEGYYAKSDEIEFLFAKNGFSKMVMRSLRGFGYNREEKLYSLLEKDKKLFNKIIELINETSTDLAIIETCGHAIYIGRKNADEKVNSGASQIL